MSDLLDRYPLTAGTYHELLDASGAVRAHWQRLLDHLQRSTPAQLTQRQALLARQIQENGVTYNVYADPKGADRPWELDLLPHVIGRLMNGSTCRPVSPSGRACSMPCSLICMARNA